MADENSTVEPENLPNNKCIDSDEQVNVDERLDSDITIEKTIIKPDQSETAVDSCASRPRGDALDEFLAGSQQGGFEYGDLENFENGGDEGIDFKSENKIPEAEVRCDEEEVVREVVENEGNNNQRNRATNVSYLAKALKRRSIKCLNSKMQIMEDVREGCDVNHPSSPGHAEERPNGEPQIKKEVVSEVTTEKVKDFEEHKEEQEIKEEIEDIVEKKSDEECDEKNENSNGSMPESNKRKLDQDESPLKRLKTEIQENFVSRDKIFNDFIEISQCQSLDQMKLFSEQILTEIKALNELAREKEREWNHILHIKKIKEELLIRVQRKRQVSLINESSIGDVTFDGTSQQSLLKCNQKVSAVRGVSVEKTNQRNILPKQQIDINSSLDFRQKQRPILDVQSIIADYRQRHPESIPRRGGNFSLGAKTLENNSDLGVLLGTTNGSAPTKMLTPESSFGNDSTSFKDILVQFAKLSQNEKSELQMHLQNAVKPPPPYPEVTVHPVTTTNTAGPTNSLLHGILTKTPPKQHNMNNSQCATNNNSKSAFSPTLARLLTAPERSVNNHMTSTPTMISKGNLMHPNNMSLSEILSTSKARNEITITPVSGQFDVTSKEESAVEEEPEEGADRLVIDESTEAVNLRKEDTSSDGGDEVPQCQGCNQKAAQFVCAGCGNQWYCSRDCQVAAWDEHSEVCSG